MLSLGRIVNIDRLIHAAETSCIIAAGQTYEELFDAACAGTDTYSRLRAVGAQTLGNSGVVVAFGDHFIGSGDLGGDYSHSVTGLGAGVAGIFEGVCSVYMDEPVVLNESQTTHVVPALELGVADITLKGVDLGVSQLFSRVAVPLLGQSPAVFRVSRNIFKRRNRLQLLGPQHDDS